MVDRHLLTINTGSSSLKAALYRLQEGATETPELRAEASGIGGRGGSLHLADAHGVTLDERQDDLPDHAAALDALLSWLRDRGLDRDDLAAVGHRIVHGGDRYRGPQRVAPEVVADLRALVPLDPDRNAAHAPVISSDDAAVTVRIVPTDEDLTVARHTRKLIEQEH